MSIFGICFILYFLKLSACRGFERVKPGFHVRRRLLSAITLEKNSL